MTTATAAPAARKRKEQPFDPFTAVFQEETWRPEHGGARLHFVCPSRRAGQPAYVLTCGEDGGAPWCSCDGYTRWGHCTHATQSAEIVRIAFVNLYDRMSDDELRAIEIDLTARFMRGPALPGIRYDVIGDELAKRSRMKDPVLLNQRGRAAKRELFGEGW